MESPINYCTTSLIDNIILYFTGNTFKSSSIVKVNSERLSENGELFFLCNLKAWKNHSICERNCANVLQHFAHTNSSTQTNTEAEVAKEVLEQLILTSKSWSIEIQRCLLRKEMACLFLNRADITSTIIKMAIKHREAFGKTRIIGKTFDLKYHPDMQSDLTTCRLRLIKDIATKVLRIHGCIILDENCANKYMFVSKSEGSIEEGYEKYICGVVKNADLNLKEVHLTWEQYIKNKMDQLMQVNKCEHFGSDQDNTNRNVYLHSLANAIVTFELMAAKPSRSVVIRINNSESDKTIINTKGALFILYNIARIVAVREKYNEKVLHGDYPNLPDIENIDFSELHEEEEWELIYNFIFGYPQMINDCLRWEPSLQIYPHKICLFLSRLCQKFSVYYRRIRILTEGGDHLLLKMFARLYMLHALQIVLENALGILNIKSVSRM